MKKPKKMKLLTNHIIFEGTPRPSSTGEGVVVQKFNGLPKYIGTGTYTSNYIKSDEIHHIFFAEIPNVKTMKEMYIVLKNHTALIFNVYAEKDEKLKTKQKFREEFK